QHSMEGGLDTTIDERGVKEVHLLAQAFNQMARTLHHNLSELQRLSSLDGLTGIANRRAFDARLEEEWTRARRNRSSLALLLIDIDFFKTYNDSLGHQAGDQCLREVAQTLQNEMKRPADLVARYGGEEFAVILPDTDQFGAGVVALNINNALRQRALHHPASSIAPIITLSIGVNAIIPDSLASTQEFIEGADRALYEVKHNGRNSIGFAQREKVATPASHEGRTLQGNQ
ncbi:MAG TPA: diguanylate cyclase, partial [Gammaproteobacteria bacterium]